MYTNLTKLIASFEVYREEAFCIATSIRPLFLRVPLRWFICGMTTAKTAFCSNLQIHRQVLAHGCTYINVICMFHIYTYIHLSICMYTHVHAHTCAHAHTNKPTHVHTYKHTHTCTHACMYACIIESLLLAYKSTCVYVRISIMYMYVHTYIFHNFIYVRGYICITFIHVHICLGLGNNVSLTCCISIFCVVYIYMNNYLLPFCIRTSDIHLIHKWTC